MSLGRIAHNHFDASEIWIGRCGGDALDDKVMVALRAVELDLAHRRPGVFETHLRERVVCAKARQRALIEFTAALVTPPAARNAAISPVAIIINATSTSTIVKPAFMTARGNGHRRCRQYARIFLLCRASQ